MNKIEKNKYTKETTNYIMSFNLLRLNDVAFFRDFCFGRKDVEEGVDYYSIYNDGGVFEIFSDFENIFQILKTGIGHPGFQFVFFCTPTSYKRGCVYVAFCKKLARKYNMKFFYSTEGAELSLILQCR